MLIVGFVLLSRLCARFFPGVNPALAGFAILLLALACKAVPVSSVEHGAKFLIAQSALFLIPPAVVVARQSSLLEAHWMPLLVTIVGGTAITAAATAFAVEFASRAIHRRRRC